MNIQKIKDPNTYTSYFNENNILTIIVNSNKLINFKLLGIFTSHVPPICHNKLKNLNLLDNKPIQFETTYILDIINHNGKMLYIYHIGNGLYEDASYNFPDPNCKSPSIKIIQKGTKGDGKTTTTWYSIRESSGQGSCGGCGAIKSAKGIGCVKNPYKEIAKELLHASPSGDIWLATATAESMSSPYCDPNGFDCGWGGDAEKIPNGKTSSAPCGSSFKLTIGTKNINVVVTDACPSGKQNAEWCPKHPGTSNNYGSYNHFDLWVGSISGEVLQKLGVTYIDFLNNPNMVDFIPQETPPYIIKILQNYCCNTWYYGQGCPRICGSDFHYVNCNSDYN